jgi:hypothetical protein
MAGAATRREERTVPAPLAGDEVVSGESAPRPVAAAEPLDRVFGETARCSTCGVAVAGYRVVALFFHQTAAIRAYCPGCYPAATEGDYHAGGDGLILDFATFAARFGAPGPPPPPVTPVDRVLLALVRDSSLRSLSPANEVFARKRGRPPYVVRAGFAMDGAEKVATLTIAADGTAAGIAGDPQACEWARTAIAKSP